MIDFNSDGDMKKLMKSVYEPVSPSPEFKEQVIENLLSEVGSAAMSTSAHVWRRLRLWVPIAVSVTSAFIGYGIWLSLKTVPMLVP